MSRPRPRALTRGARALACIAAASVVVIGCPPPPPVSLAYGPRNYTERDYERIVERWSRSLHVIDFDGIEDRIRVDATYHSWDFRWALAVRQAHDQTLSVAARDAAIREGQQAVEREHEFFVALYSEYTRWSQLNRNFTAWQIRLIDDRGREVEPSRIEAIRRVGAADRTYYPYLTPWRTVFRIHFPRRFALPNGVEDELIGPSTRYFILRFRGPRGTADLRWDIASTASSGSSTP